MNVSAQAFRRPGERSWSQKCTSLTACQIAVYLAVCFIALLSLPNSIYSPEVLDFVYVIGVLGIWRYLWWGNHWLRALVFSNITYPRMRARAAALWGSGWRPRHIHIQLTTFKEHRAVSEAVIRALVRDIRASGIAATIWLGSSEAEDEQRIADHLALVGSDCDITLRIIRQNQPGKRVAIALILRAMSRAGISGDDLIIFMDGDFVIHPGMLRRCLPLFALDPVLHALTTDEYVEVIGPRWMQTWLDMRFSQRRLAMQSHALSNRVLTLTGRFSVFRARHVISNEFIRLQEVDCLDHWLWGSFRFMSGDDKSSWYCLLRKGVKMTYVPDASGTTIEVVEGSGFRRMVENLRRWSGNMLRNGQRAIALGPHRMPFFIWWCLIDQRLAMWTMLFSPMLAVAGTLKVGFAFLVSYVIFVAVTRMLLSMVLWTYAPRVDLGYVWTLYANQLLNAGVKVIMLWRLAQQNWANRGNQKSGIDGGGWVAVAREAMARYLTFVSFAGLFLAAMIYMRLLELPSWGLIVSVFLN
ncbi:MAG: glycosyltransferase family 2 protein [Alphaproteobacteria bacterium]|nr:glycosyltransferase family 2 protein [Alphaproteobacteria bacterium]